jgi:hypothetical protein
MIIKCSNCQVPLIELQDSSIESCKEYGVAANEANVECCFCGDKSFSFEFYPGTRVAPCGTSYENPYVLASNPDGDIVGSCPDFKPDLYIVGLDRKGSNQWTFKTKKLQ